VKKNVLALLLLSSIGHAKPTPGLNDYGVLLSPGRFTTHCVINDPGVSGSSTANAYTNGQISCSELQHLYTEIYTQAREYLTTRYKYDFNSPAPTKSLSLRILTLAELNNPDNFSQTNPKCMYNVKCDTGAYFGRTFYADTSSNINVYVVHNALTGKYSFVSTLKHELMHAILYRYRWNYLLGESKEHALIDKFLVWRGK